MQMGNKEKAAETFLAYASRYDLDDPKIRLKADHTLRVASHCDRIGKSLGMSTEDAELSFMTGILHDIGRFEQVRIYHTFRDSLSVNHAGSRTGIDFLMGHIGFVFGLVYPESFKIIKEQGYLEEMLAFKSWNEETRRRMDLVREKVHQYMESHTETQ